MGLVVPPVADFPADSDVARAKDLLMDELLGDFPFASDADKAHALSEIMTPMVRQLISGPTPLHLNEAPSPGSGKDLLADCASVIVTGALPPAMTEGRDDDEWRKRLTAKLITSPSIVLIDNVKRHLDSGALSAALERPIWEDRHLGLSRMVSMPIRCLWICSANNPSLSEEIARRTARVRIDPQMETPWERTGFRHPDLRKWVREHRGELLWAVLTLVHHWVGMGRPQGDQSMGSYESWAEVMGGILKAADIPGFLENRQAVYRQAQSNAEVIKVLVERWWQEYQNQRVDVGNLFDLAKRHQLLTELRAGRTDQGARVALGRMLSALRDRIIGQYRIKQVGVGHGRGMAYQLEEFNPINSESGKSSPSSPSSADPQGHGGEDGDDGDIFPTPSRFLPKLQPSLATRHSYGPQLVNLWSPQFIPQGTVGTLGTLKSLPILKKPITVMEGLIPPALSRQLMSGRRSQKGLFAHRDLSSILICKLVKDSPASRRKLIRGRAMLGNGRKAPYDV
jgi:hypothetical protein